MIRKRHACRVDGVLLLDKPRGPGSNAVLQHVRRLYQAERAGHTGTLDPLASGLLPICFGEATKFSGDLLDADKGYVATIRLGQRTATGDAEVTILETRLVQVSRAHLEEVLAGFRGEIDQTPPMFSALKLAGRPLYELARKGETVERRPRRVRILRLDLSWFEGQEFAIYVRCSKGTYVRTLAEDIGTRLGCGGHLSNLHRVEIGSLDVGAAATVDALDAMSAEERQGRLLPADILVRSLSRIDLTDTDAIRFCRGQGIALPGNVGGLQQATGRIRVYGAEDRFLGVADLGTDAVLSPHRLLRST